MQSSGKHNWNSLFVDKLTEKLKRTTNARICVKVDTSCIYYESVLVVLDQKHVFNVIIEYNWKLTMCTYCKVFGHSDNKCSKEAKVQSDKQVSIWIHKPEKQVQQEGLVDVVDASANKDKEAETAK